MESWVEEKTLLDLLIGLKGAVEMGVWQQSFVRAWDERDDGVSDYMIEVLRKKGESRIRLNRCTRMFMQTGTTRYRYLLALLYYISYLRRHEASSRSVAFSQTFRFRLRLSCGEQV